MCKKQDDFVERVAWDVLGQLEDEVRQYVFLHPDADTHRWGLGLRIRKQYIHGKELGFLCSEPDALSSQIVQKLASLIIEDFDYDNPFYRMVYNNPQFNNLRRQYYVAFDHYPSSFLESYAHEPDANKAAKRAFYKLRELVAERQKRNLMELYGRES